MNKADCKAEARRWLRYACEDLRAAEVMLAQKDIAPRHVCWLAQQSAEKAIKAVLVFEQCEFPKTHDLDMLGNLLGDDWSIKSSFA